MLSFMDVSKFLVLQNFKGCQLWVQLSQNFVKLRQGSGKERQGMALKAKSLKA